MTGFPRESTSAPQPVEQPPSPPTWSSETNKDRTAREDRPQ